MTIHHPPRRGSAKLSGRPLSPPRDMSLGSPANGRGPTSEVRGKCLNSLAQAASTSHAPSRPARRATTRRARIPRTAQVGQQGHHKSRCNRRSEVLLPQSSGRGAQQIIRYESLDHIWRQNGLTIQPGHMELQVIASGTDKSASAERLRGKRAHGAVLATTVRTELIDHMSLVPHVLRELVVIDEEHHFRYVYRRRVLPRTVAVAGSSA
jgi:hypothetical protein